MKKVYHGKNPPFEFSQITKYVYIGTDACCTINFQRKLLQKHIKADISLESERLDKPYGVDYYLWLPVKNHYAPTQMQLKLGVEFIDSLIKKKHPVFVHCRNGHGRAPTLVAAYLISKGMKIEEAIKFVKNKRPVVHLNERQLASLRKFKKSLKY